MLSGEDPVVKKGGIRMIKYDEIVGMPVLSTKEGKDPGCISKMAIDLKKGKEIV